jgi:hypothetical protein
MIDMKDAIQIITTTIHRIIVTAGTITLSVHHKGLLHMHRQPEEVHKHHKDHTILPRHNRVLS